VAGTLGDVIQLTLQGTFQSSIWMNVFYYISEGSISAGYLTGITTEFQAVVLDAMADAQTDLVDYVSLRALNIFSGDELVVAPLTPPDGNVTPSTGAGASFLAANYKLIRSNARVRHGQKYLTGLQESWFEANDLQAAYLTLASAVSAAFAATLVAGLTDEFVPVIVGRIEYTTSGGNQAYRLPTSQAEMDDKWAYVSSAIVNPLLTTERSRKLGHGI